MNLPDDVNGLHNEIAGVDARRGGIIGYQHGSERRYYVINGGTNDIIEHKLSKVRRNVSNLFAVVMSHLLTCHIASAVIVALRSILLVMQVQHEDLTYPARNEGLIAPHALADDTDGGSPRSFGTAE
jgi:hypothetical protein